MKAFLKRYTALICALACVLALCGAWTGIRLSAGAGTYRLYDIEGDAAYLEGIRIDMTVSDAVHAQHITLDGGALSHSCEYISPLTPSDMVWFNRTQAFVEDENADVKAEASTTLEESDEDFELWVTRMKRAASSARISVAIEQNNAGASHTETRVAQVVTDVTVSGEGYPFTFTLMRETIIYKNQISAEGEPLPDTTSETPFDYVESTAGPVSDMGYCDEPLIAQASDGTIYFTPSLLPYYGGTSAIYRVNQWGSWEYTCEPTAAEDGRLYYPDFNARTVGDTEKLAEFPAEGLRTVALDVTGDHLCLLLVKDRMLTLRIYGLDGAFQSETPLYEVGPKQELTRTLFSNESGGATMLCYCLQDETDNTVWNSAGTSTLLCVGLDKETAVKSMITDRGSVEHAAFIGNRWVLAEAEFQDWQRGNEWPIKRYYVRVLDAGGATLYAGELATDISEDEIQNYYSMNETQGKDDYTVMRWLSVDAITEE